MNTIAIVPAAGAGKRFGSKTNKAFHLLSEKPVILRVLEILQGIEEIDEIIPVLREDDMEKGLWLIEERGVSKVKKIAPGGDERQQSVFHALKLINNTNSIILIHDGVRPLISRNLIKSSLSSLGSSQGVISAVPLTDTIKEVEDNFVKRTLDRAGLIAVQTPQVFYFDPLFDAYTKAINDGLFFTDDAAVMEYAGGTVKVINGDYRNIKITTGEDIEYGEFLLSKYRDIQAGL